MPHPIVLASTSPFRRLLLQNAGLIFGIERPQVDERAIDAPLIQAGASPSAVALELAKAKAREVSHRFPKHLVIGCDQTMSLGEQVFHKAKDRDEAMRNLMRLAGKTHQLNSAIALFQNGEDCWSHVAHARLTMRPLGEDFISYYLDSVGESAFSSVGSYQLEGMGIQLFSEVVGDYFTILGLPLLPLLEQLRAMGEIRA